jgi:hypothetical protein
MCVALVPDRLPPVTAKRPHRAALGWAVTLNSLEDQTFSGKTLEEALVWCLVWLMAPESGVGPFRV